MKPDEPCWRCGHNLVDHTGGVCSAWIRISNAEILASREWLNMDAVVPPAIRIHPIEA